MAQGTREESRARAVCALLAASGTLLAHVCRADEPQLEAIVVTGTRIARADFVSPSPIVTVPSVAFEQTGAVSVASTLDLYPQFVPTAGATSNAPGNDGAANVSLRGLGPTRTLVLLDGRRLVPADGRGAVDLNIVPTALIESVQITTGGASAVYGSDAIAGVVDLRVRRRFEGVRIEGSATTTERGDGGEYSAGITAGTDFGTGRGSMVGYVGYSRREGIDQDARAFSRYPLDYVRGLTDGRGPGGAFVGLGSGITDDGVHIVFSNRATFGSLFAGYGYAPGQVPYQAGFGLNADGTVFTIGNSSPGSVANYRGVRDPVMFNDRSYGPYNYAPTTALQMPLERATGFLSGRFDVNDRVELYGQALYSRYEVQRRLAPAEIGILLIPPTNPYVPADLQVLLDSRANPSAPYRYFRRATEVGPQVALNERDVVQATAGVHGTLAGDWEFDAYVQFGENDRREQQTHNVSLSKLQDLTFAPDGGTSICAGGFDPYHAGSLSPDCARYIDVDASNLVRLQQSIAEISFTGPVIVLPAGPLRAATGLLYRRDRFDYDASSALNAMLPGVPGVIGPRPDIAGFAAAPDRSGDESNVDTYVELRLPLLQDQPGAQSLELDLGYRYSEYSQAGGAGSYKAELLYRPVTHVRLRGSYQHAVRAPSIEELYYPPVADQFEIPIPDPCDTNSNARTGSDALAVQALCLAQGLPAALLPSYDYELRRVDGVEGGNPDLRPEQADTYTLGVVWTAPAARSGMRDLQVSVDAYRMEIEDGIGRWDALSAVSRCFDPQYNPGYDPANVYCRFFTRDSITGNIFARILDGNIGGFETDGVDAQLDWGFDLGPGTLGLNALISYVNDWTYRDPGGGDIAYVGTVGGSGLGRSLPRWKSLLQASYSIGGTGFGARWQRVAAMRDAVERDFHVPARDYVSLDASHAVREGALSGLSIRIGVENLLDQQPPIFPTWQQANTDPSQYDVLGRRYFARLQYQFK